MSSVHPLGGVHAAAVTPLRDDGTPDLPGLGQLLHHLADRGCHGALILGTTGEGPSFSPDERLSICRAALRVRETHPAFRLFAGTGTPSLEETIFLTRSAFDLGFDAAVVLPPYFFRTVADDGLCAWFETILQRAVPANGHLLGYHIPGISGVPLSLDLIARLRDRSAERFAGIKDSSADGNHARRLGERFGTDLLVLNGTDSLFAEALDHEAGGCITACANLISPDLRRVWEAHRAGNACDREAAMVRVNAARATLERFPPLPAIVKALLARLFDFPRWPVRLPLGASTEDAVERAAAELHAAGIR